MYLSAPWFESTECFPCLWDMENCDIENNGNHGECTFQNKWKKKKKERDGGGEWEGVGVVTAWWVNKYLNFLLGYLCNHEICRVMLYTPV